MEDILKDIIRNTYHRYIPPDVKIIERNGYIFFVGQGRCFDPIITPMLIATTIFGTVMSMKGTREEGRQAEQISKQRAAVDIKSAEAVRRTSVEEARIKKERGRRLLAQQQATAAAGGIKINVGAPLVIEAQTRADIAKDIGFVLERGREESAFYRSRAGIEIATGKAKRKKSKWDALSQGLTGFGSLAKMGTDAGWWGN